MATALHNLRECVLHPSSKQLKNGGRLAGRQHVFFCHYTFCNTTIRTRKSQEHRRSTAAWVAPPRTIEPGCWLSVRRIGSADVVVDGRRVSGPSFEKHSARAAKGLGRTDPGAQKGWFTEHHHVLPDNVRLLVRRLLLAGFELAPGNCRTELK